MYQVPADSLVYANGQPVAWTTVQPGARVVIPQGQLVELRDGRYMVVQSPGTVVTPAPGAVVASPGVRQTLYGRVTDVDRNEIRVRTADKSFEIKMADPKAAGIRKGDNVQIDLTFSPTSPSALPR